MRWPKIKAVEMEGAGVGNAIEQLQSLGITVGFMMIRGISDLPSLGEDSTRRTMERDKWKLYASDTAAAFVAGWIANGLPLRLSARKSVHMEFSESHNNEIRSKVQIAMDISEGITSDGNATGNAISADRHEPK